MTEDELVQKVARALARQAHSSGGMERITDPYTADAEYWNDQARAAIAVLRPLIRNEALEEAAKVCDGVSKDIWTRVGGPDARDWMEATAEDCAAAIRELKGKP